jgi:NAD(P)-dependent dehydrogenase (short-subunit alcohol dehydrogenase family)
MTQLRFDDRVVIVTGAGNGLGKSHALEFARRGACVVVNDLGSSTQGEGQNRRAADTVVDDIVAAGGEAVANYDSVTQGDKIVQTALDNFGRIDIVINNAGILRDKSFAKMSEEDWDLVYQVHVKGAFSVTHAAWPHLRERQFGRIIFTSSASGLYGNFGQANYSMAKLGLHGLCQTLAIEGRKDNILCNSIAPVAGSRMTQALLPPALFEQLKPDYVTPLVIKLCAEASQDNGLLFEVGAGWVGRLRWERSRGKGFTIDAGLCAEQLAEHWAEINDFSGADHPANGQEAMAAMLANLTKR